MKKKPFPFLDEPIPAVSVMDPPIPLTVIQSTGRELLRMNHDGSLVFAPDLTFDEAKQIIRDLVPLLIKPRPTGHINPDTRTYSGDEAPEM